MIKNLLIMLFLFICAINYSQVTLDADGPGDTYELINNALAPGYDAVESPDCGHTEFGRHIEEVWDTDLKKYVFKFDLHVTPDNDRCINYDRQRVEIKTYDPSPENLKGTIGETITYKWKFKLSEGFKPSYSFTHVFQIKAVGGDDSLPIFTLTPRKGSPNKLELIYIKDEFTASNKIAVVDLEGFDDEWVEVSQRIKVGQQGFYSIDIKKVSDGTTLLSYENSNISTIRTSNEYIRPKWGIYRSIASPEDLRDETVYFSDFSINESSRKIFLKLDDVVVKDNSTLGAATLDYLVEKKIKASFGLVATRNDASTLSIFGNYLNEKNENNEKLIEIWHHGYDHLNPEFDGTSYTYQKEHFDNADEVLSNLLRLQMHTFGAPFNHNDDTTNLVVSENSNYKVTFFNNPAPDSNTGILNLKNRVNIENGTGNPEYDYFVTNYNTYKDSYLDYMVLQGHPNVWDESNLNEFKKIIDFLLIEGCEFFLPYDYYLSLNPTIVQPSSIQTINFTDIPLKTTSDEDFEPQAVSSSGLEVLYNSSNPEVATIIDNKIHIIDSGTSTITASQMGNEIYKSSDYVSQTLTVSKSNLANTGFNVPEFKYFPNPVKSWITISHVTEPILFVQVYNLFGQMIFKSSFNRNPIKVDLSSLSPSVYYILIETSKGRKIIKVLKE